MLAILQRRGGCPPPTPTPVTTVRIFLLGGLATWKSYTQVLSGCATVPRNPVETELTLACACSVLWNSDPRKRGGKYSTTPQNAAISACNQDFSVKKTKTHLGKEKSCCVSGKEDPLVLLCTRQKVNFDTKPSPAHVFFFQTKSQAGICNTWGNSRRAPCTHPSGVVSIPMLPRTAGYQAPLLPTLPCCSLCPWSFFFKDRFTKMFWHYLQLWLWAGEPFGTQNP